MRWTERQRAMLQEIGVRIWPLQRAGAAARGAVPADLPLPEIAAAEAGVVEAVEVREMDWDALRTAAAACTACGLCSGRTHSVFGAGHLRAHWMVVGGAPTEADDESGEPFGGPAGQLLDNMLRAIGLTRGVAPPSRQVYVADAVKCRPPGGRSPEAAEVAQCASFLLRQVQLVRPRIILAMGSFAVQSLLRSSEPMGRLRGRVHHHEGVPLIVTYDPSYLLRNPADKARAWDDLCLAVQTLAVDASA